MRKNVFAEKMIKADKQNVYDEKMIKADEKKILRWKNDKSR